jgi:uncharacterized protein YbcI
MDRSILQRADCDALAATLRIVWEQWQGVAPENVRVLAGTDSVAAWLEGVFSPAEWKAAQHVESRPLFQHYADRLVATIQPELQALVGNFLKRRIVSAHVHASVSLDHVLCIFVLGEPLP